MIEVTIEHKGKKFKQQHPELFNELDRNQFISVVEMAILHPVRLENRVEDQISLMQILLKTPVNRYVKNKWYHIINDIVDEGILAEILELQNFIFKEQVFNNWLIKNLCMGNECYYGPMNRFSYMKFGEFISADMLFMGYFDSKNPDLLNKFISVLYRERDYKKKEGDIRLEFDSASIDRRSLVMTKLSEVMKQSIIFNYAGMRQWLTEKYKMVFGSKEQSSANIQFGSNNASWLSVRKHLAGDVFNLEKVDNLLLHDVFDDLNDKMSQ